MEQHLTRVQTILDYPDDSINVYTNGSALEGTINACLCVRTEYTEGPLKEIAFQGGNLCFNYDAKAYAFKAAI